MKKDYLKYFNKIKLKKNAIVVADNVISHKEKVKEYVDYVRKNYESCFFEIGSGVEISFVR
mgnify:CR=1 FL=1